MLRVGSGPSSGGLKEASGPWDSGCVLRVEGSGRASGLQFASASNQQAMETDSPTSDCLLDTKTLNSEN